MTARALLGTILGLAAAGLAQARLGETMPELVARFGESIAHGKMTIFVDGRQRETGQTRSFRLEDWRIDVVMIDGRCARIRYAKSGAWTDEQVAAVLEANAHEQVWTEKTPPASGRKWLRADGATALWEKDRHIILELPLYEERIRRSPKR